LTSHVITKECVHCRLQIGIQNCKMNSQGVHLRLQWKGKSQKACNMLVGWQTSIRFYKMHI
jgi:hypothetical protein